MPTAILTRSREDNTRTAPLFEETGIDVISLPMIKIHELPFNPSQIDQLDPDEQPLILLTSIKGTRRWLDLREKHDILRRIEPTGYLLVGNRSRQMIEATVPDARILVTASSAEHLGKEVSTLPDLSLSADTKEKRGTDTLLYPCSAIRREETVDIFRERGYRILELPLYEPVLPEQSIAKLSGMMQSLEEETVIIFFSPSAVHNFFSIYHANPNRLNYATIGETTAGALQEQGINNIITPEEPTLEYLVRTIKDFFND